MDDNLVADGAEQTPPQSAPSEGKDAPVTEPQLSDVEGTPEPWLTSTHPPTSSDGQTELQEQQERPSAPAKTEQPDIDKLVAERVEEMRRKFQSDYDKARHQAQMGAQAEAYARLQAELQQQADAQRISSMDDEEFGRFYREQSKANVERQALLSQAQQQAALGWVNTIRAIAAKQLTEEERAEFARRDTPGAEHQFQSFEEMMDFLTTARMNRELQRAVKEKEKTIREAIEKERASQEADASAPILDSGRPAPSAAGASSEENILAGLINLQRNKRRG